MTQDYANVDVEIGTNELECGCFEDWEE
jgi:hypothetical protein